MEGSLLKKSVQYILEKRIPFNIFLKKEFQLVIVETGKLFPKYIWKFKGYKKQKKYWEKKKLEHLNHQISTPSLRQRDFRTRIGKQTNRTD